MYTHLLVSIRDVGTEYNTFHIDYVKDFVRKVLREDDIVFEIKDDNIMYTTDKSRRNFVLFNRVEIKEEDKLIVLKLRVMDNSIIKYGFLLEQQETRRYRDYINNVICVVK